MPKLKDRHKAKVMFGYLAPGEVRMEFMDSVTATYRRYMDARKHRIYNQVSLNCGPRIAEGRCQVVDIFADSNCDWLWMVDSDMTFEEDALDMLIDTAYNHDARIVGGLCFAGRADSKMFPTIYELFPREEEGHEGEWATRVVEDYPEDEVIAVGATGAAFMLIHREVFAAMQKAYGTLPNGERNPYPWFVEASNGGRPFGEDIAFCLRAKSLGYDILVDTRVKVGHVKNIVLTEEGFKKQRSDAATLSKEPAKLSLP